MSRECAVSRRSRCGTEGGNVFFQCVFAGDCIPNKHANEIPKRCFLSEKSAPFISEWVANKTRKNPHRSKRGVVTPSPLGRCFTLNTLEAS